VLFVTTSAGALMACRFGVLVSVVRRNS